MVLHKRSGYGFRGYEIPTMPRGSRSARKKRAVRYHVNPTTELCAIDLLATVAGKLLLEKEKSVSSPGPLVSVKTEDRATPPVKVEPCDQGSCDEGAPVTRCQKLSHKHAFKETNSQASITSSAFLGAATNNRVDVLKSKIAGLSGPVFPTASNARHSPVSVASGSPKRGDKGVVMPPVAATLIRINNPCNNTSDVKAAPTDQGDKAEKAAATTVEEQDPMDVDSKPKLPSPPLLASSDSSVVVPATYSSPRGLMPRSSSIPRFTVVDQEDNGDAGGGDNEDDGNSSTCTHPSSVSPRAAAFRPQRIGDRRIRKLLSSKFWKAGPAAPKEGEFYDRDLFRSKKLCYTRQKTQRSFFKRKKLLERSSVSSSSAGIVTETICKLSPDYNNKSIKGGEQGNGTSSSITSHRTSFKTEDYKVKLKIKSFKVPELFIEMPETATVGSLKRAVLETVTAMLGNGLKVGVIYQGRKVRDDSRTLVQAGITSGDNRLDSLNFSLEPNASLPASPQIPRVGSSSFRAEALPSEQCRSPRPLAARLPALPEFRADTAKSTGNQDAREQQHQLEPNVLGLASPAGSDNSSKAVAAATNGSFDADADASGAIGHVSSSLSRALVPVNPSPHSSSELALAVVPASNKTTRRPETGQRRIRRPFSVAEVEALVQAVEKLGTGRWRDVKLQAFENAKHRTYVDLKDKWKTLVHTARISPQQRRGEPVPQELLDRVLVAHAHWSQHQARLQSSKHAAAPPPHQQKQPSCLLPPPPQPEQQQQLAQPLALPPPQAAAV